MTSIVRKLELSNLNLSQSELLGHDIDIDAFKTVIGGKIGSDLIEAITDARVTRTIDGASTIEVDVNDHDGYLIRSGRLNTKMDVKIEGLWFRYRQLKLSGDDITLVFEDREIAVLRTYNSFIAPIARTAEMTRAMFILRLIKEVKEFDIPYYIPELHKQQPIEQSANVPTIGQQQTTFQPGIHPNENLTVKHTKATGAQISNADTIIRTGISLIPDTNPHKRKLLVCSIMTAIQESTLNNIDYGDTAGPDSRGLFQQRDPWGPLTVRMDPVGAAGLFFNGNPSQGIRGAIQADANNPNLSYTLLCQAVQVSAYPNAYAQWQGEAEAFVDSFGAPGKDSIEPGRNHNSQKHWWNNFTIEGHNAWDLTAPTTAPPAPLPVSPGISDYHFYRGKQGNTGQAKWLPESSWECIQRLAQEVNWRAFFISGTFYYMPEDEMFKAKPRAILSRDSPGVVTISGDYDQNKKTANVDIECYIGRFEVVPGAVIKLEDMGPFNGRWLISTIDRSLYYPQGTINLKKSDPVITTLEPLQDSLTQKGFPSNFGSSTPTPQNSGGAGYDFSQWKNIFHKSWDEIVSAIGSVTDIKHLANMILDEAAKGNYRSESNEKAPTSIQQWHKLAEGLKLHNQCGDDVDLDPKVAVAILALINNGFKVGTFALCENHKCRADSGNVSQHALGQAVDISSLGRADAGWRYLNVDDPLAVVWVREVMYFLRQMNPSQIICNGVGKIDTGSQDIKVHQWNHGQEVSSITDDHIDHIHLGV